MNIYLDFDGTVVEHAYPKIGRAVPHAMRVVEKLYKAGHNIILNTVRCEEEYNNGTLQKAIDYIQLNLTGEDDIILHSCTKTKFHPVWEPANTEYIYIDDIARGIPLIPAIFDGKNMVDWAAVEKILEENKILKS